MIRNNSNKREEVNTNETRRNDFFIFYAKDTAGPDGPGAGRAEVRIGAGVRYERCPSQ
jgi:hypothetical protein